MSWGFLDTDWDPRHSGPGMGPRPWARLSEGSQHVATIALLHAKRPIGLSPRPVDNFHRPSCSKLSLKYFCLRTRLTKSD